MAIFNSYVSLPEGSWWFAYHFCSIFLSDHCRQHLDSRWFRSLAYLIIWGWVIFFQPCFFRDHRLYYMILYVHMAVCQNLVALVNIKIAGKWMFISLKMVLIGIDPIWIITDKALANWITSEFLPWLCTLDSPFDLRQPTMRERHG